MKLGTKARKAMSPVIRGVGGVVAIILLGPCFGFAAAGFAQSSADSAQDAKLAPPPPIVRHSGTAQIAANSTDAATTFSPAPAKGTHEGIQIHGHWVIEVRNPDGTLGQRREFENALVPQGTNVLAGVLSGSAVVASWQVLLLDAYEGVPTGGPCNGQPCVIPVAFPTAGCGSCGSGVSLGSAVNSQGVTVTSLVFTGSQTLGENGGRHYLIR